MPARIGARWRAATWIVILAILVFRCGNALRYPVLFGEDGTHLFMFYMENRGLDSLFRAYAGYVSFAPNMMGWLIGTLPLVAQPFVLAGNAVLVSVMCFWLFSSERFAQVLPDLRLRCVACVGMALVPMGNFALVTCTMFVNWHLLLAVSLLALATPPRTTFGRISEFGFVWLCLWTNPVSIVLLPIFLWRALRVSELPSLFDRGTYGAYAVLVLLYQLLFVGTGGVNDTPGSTSADATPLAVLDSTLQLGARRVMTEPFLGSAGRFALENAWSMMAYLPGLLVVLFVGMRYRELPIVTRRWVVGAGSLALGMTLAIAYARFDGWEGMLVWGHRYTYVQKLLVYLTVLVVMFSNLRRRLLVAGAVLAHASLLAVLAGSDETFRLDYHTDPATGQRVIKFVAEAARWRENPGSAAKGMDRMRLNSPYLEVRRARISGAAAPR
jgi:hypothetical protein